MAAFGLAVFAIVFCVACMSFEAWAVTVLWGWYVMPLGATALKMGHAFGLICLVGMVTHQHVSRDFKDSKQALEFLLHQFFRPAALLFYAWLSRQL